MRVLWKDARLGEGCESSRLKQAFGLLFFKDSPCVGGLVLNESWERMRVDGKDASLGEGCESSGNMRVLGKDASLGEGCESSGRMRVLGKGASLVV